MLIRSLECVLGDDIIDIGSNSDLHPPFYDHWLGALEGVLSVFLSHPPPFIISWSSVCCFDGGYFTLHWTCVVILHK